MKLPNEFKFKIKGSDNVIYSAELDDQHHAYHVKGENRLSMLIPVDFVQGNIQNESWVITVKYEDIINKPSHYHKNAIDVVGYLEQHFPLEGEFTVSEGFYIGNTIKYVSRYKEKNGLEDLEKAAFYLGKLIDIEKAKEKA